MNERLQKVLAAAGYGSRREIERWITAGRVSVNNEVAQLGQRVSLEDVVAIDGKRVRISQVSTRRVIIYNKPEGQVSTRSDPEGRPTVFDRLPASLTKGASGKQKERWIAVGRLDLNTSGLLLFTTDGELANALMHPSSQVDREYAVRVKGEVTDDTLQVLREGVLLEDGLAKFTDIQRGRDSTGLNQWFYVVLMEGRNREVRRLWESQDVQVSRLKRVRYGNVFMPSTLKSGMYQELTNDEVNQLAALVGLAPSFESTDNDKHDARRRYRAKRTNRPARRR